MIDGHWRDFNAEEAALEEDSDVDSDGEAEGADDEAEEAGPITWVFM